MNYQSMTNELEKLAYAPPLSLPKGKLLKKLIRAHRLPKGAKERVELAKRLRSRRTRTSTTPMSSAQAANYQSGVSTSRTRKRVLVGAGLGLAGFGAGLAASKKKEDRA